MASRSVSHPSLLPSAPFQTRVLVVALFAVLAVCAACRLFMSATATMAPSQRPLETTAMTCQAAATGVSSPELLSKWLVRDQYPHAMQNETHALHALVKKAPYGRIATTSIASHTSRNAAIEADEARFPPAAPAEPHAITAMPRTA